MNQKTASLFIRIEPELKKDAESILSSLGVTASSAINMFYKQIVLKNGLPFDVTLPKELDMDHMSKEELEAAIQKGLDDIENNKFATVQEVHEELQKLFNK